MYLIKNTKLGILVHAILVQTIISNKLSILSNKPIICSIKLIIISSKLCILVQAILVQRYSCAPNIIYYINYSSLPLAGTNLRRICHDAAANR